MGFFLSSASPNPCIDGVGLQGPVISLNMRAETIPYITTRISIRNIETELYLIHTHSLSAIHIEIREHRQIFTTGNEVR
jgi:hypothetical protein